MTELPLPPVMTSMQMERQISADLPKSSTDLPGRRTTDLPGRRGRANQRRTDLPGMGSVTMSQEDLGGRSGGPVTSSTGRIIEAPSIQTAEEAGFLAQVECVTMQ